MCNVISVVLLLYSKCNFFSGNLLVLSHHLVPYLPTIPKKVNKLILQDFLNVKVTRLLIGLPKRFGQSEAVLLFKLENSGEKRQRMFQRMVSKCRHRVHNHQPFLRTVLVLFSRFFYIKNI